MRGLWIAIAAFVAMAPAAAAAERTGWEDIPPNEAALVCSATLKETRQVLHGQNQAIFHVPMAAEPVRAPAALQTPPPFGAPGDEAQHAAYARWTEARDAYVTARNDRFRELLIKSRPEEAPNPNASCRIETFALASSYRRSGGSYSVIFPTVIGTEIRDPYKPNDLSKPVYAKVYREDFLPPDWTKGLPPFALAQAQQADSRSPTAYVACYVFRIPGPASAYLPVVRSTEGDVFNNFKSKAEKGVLPARQPGQFLECETGATPEAAEAARIKTGYVKTSELAWPKNLDLATMDPLVATTKAAPAQAPAPAPKAPSSGGYLTVKQDTSAADARRAWDAQVAKALQDEAQKKVLTLARQAQADARLQADAERARQERVKRGRAQ